MKKRSFLKMLLLTAVGVVTYGGYRFSMLFSNPDFSTLQNEKEMLINLAETILPISDLPGVNAEENVKVLLKLIADCESPQSQNNFIAGISEVNNKSNDLFGMPFNNCSTPQRVIVIESMKTEPVINNRILEKIKDKVVGKDFYSLLKEYVVFVVCTSKQGATELLSYDYLPGMVLGCIDLDSNQKAWATH